MADPPTSGISTSQKTPCFTPLLKFIIHRQNRINGQSQALSKSSEPALSPQANYSDRRRPIVDEILVPTFVDRGVSRSQRGGSPTVVNLSFLDRSRYFSFK
jgi:hypothetical protein